MLYYMGNRYMIQHCMPTHHNIRYYTMTAYTRLYALIPHCIVVYCSMYDRTVLRYTIVHGAKHNPIVAATLTYYIMLYHGTESYDALCYCVISFKLPDFSILSHPLALPPPPPIRVTPPRFRWPLAPPLPLPHTTGGLAVAPAAQLQQLREGAVRRQLADGAGLVERPGDGAQPELRRRRRGRHGADGSADGAPPPPQTELQQGLQKHTIDRSKQGNDLDEHKSDEHYWANTLG